MVVSVSVQLLPITLQFFSKQWRNGLIFVNENKNNIAMHEVKDCLRLKSHRVVGLIFYQFKIADTATKNG